MPYGGTAGSGATLAATGVASGYLWLVAAGLLMVVLGAFLIRFSFRPRRSPLDP